MTNQERIEIKTIIDLQIKEIKNSIVNYKEMTKPIAPDDAIGRVTRMDAINNKSVMEASLRQAEFKLQRLQNTLLRIDNKDFGTCIRCKKEIPLNRIKLVLDSLKCVECS